MCMWVLFQYTPSLNTSTHSLFFSFLSLMASLVSRYSFVFECFVPHVWTVRCCLEVVGSHSTQSSGRAVKRKRGLCSAPRLHYSIGLGLHAVYLLIRPTVVLLSIKGFAQSVTVKGSLLLFFPSKACCVIASILTCLTVFHVIFITVELVNYFKFSKSHSCARDIGTV